MRIASLAAVLSLFALALLLSPALADDKKDDKKEEKAKDLIVGKWVPTDENAKKAGITIEFTKDGKVQVKGKFNDQNIEFNGTYKFTGDEKMEIELTIGEEKKKDSVTVKVTKDELTTTDSKDKKETFKRAK
jgi:uncharacterized protein (TIGR03066 family)